MTILELLVMLVIAAVCGGIGAALGGDARGSGCLVSLALGFIGALLGTWIARAAGWPAIFAITFGGEVTFPIVWSIIGSALFVAVLNLLSRRPYGPDY